MALKLMYITNRPEIAQIAQDAGVDRIFVDMEYIGKADRQGGMDTVQCHHTIEDVVNIRKITTRADVMVRVNPIHEATRKYGSSKEEIDAVIEAGADILMLPFFRTVEEVRTFIKLVGGRVKILLLLETPEAVEIVDELLRLSEIDEIFIGLNDLSLGYDKKFMFEVLSDGTVEKLCNKFMKKGIPYGFGGLASLDGGLLPGRMVLKEHYRLGSSSVILSRSFCNINKVTDLNEIEEIFKNGISDIRSYEKDCINAVDFDENKRNVQIAVEKIVGDL